jgi:UDP-glucose 4-epimerase
VGEDDVAVLAHGRVLDTERLRRELGYECRYTTRAAFEDFVAGRALLGTGARPIVRGLERLSRTMAASSSSASSSASSSEPSRGTMEP